jgi:histidinol phosphatase-like PHP family hydrolase
MIDLHTHSLFSDGELLLSELIRRAHSIGYQAIAVTDHVDSSNMDFVIPRVVKAMALLSEAYPDMKLIPGVELTHVPPLMIAALVVKARAMGAKVVVVHGETLVEPVLPQTNLAAIEAQVDILAHPGLITKEEAALAAQNRVALEITYRKGHSLANGHVAKLAIDNGAALVVNSDAHSPSDLITREMAEKVLIGSGLSQERAQAVLTNTELWIKNFT